MREFRKHISQMTFKEVGLLKEIIQSKTFNYTYYCESRLSERDIKTTQVNDTIHDGKIIEFHYKSDSSRVLLRSLKNYNGKAVCVVVDITNNLIITCYYNHFYDEHFTLNIKEYDKTIDIMDIVEKQEKTINEGVLLCVRQQNILIS